MQGDTYWSNVKLLMHMEGTEGGTSFTCEVGKTITNTVSYPVVRTYGAKAVGKASASFSGQSYFSIASSSDFDYGSGAYTIEFHIFTLGVSCRALMFGSNGSASSLQMSFSSDGSCWFGEATGNSPLSGLSLPAGTIKTAVWTHIAMVWESTTTYAIYVNGVQKTRTTTGKPWPTGARTLFIGFDKTAFDQGYDTGHLVGFLDDIRITKGVARYTSNFTAPKYPFPHATQLAVEGTVNDDSGPLARKVYAYRRSDGSYIGTSTSLAGDGSFGIPSSEDCFCVCLDSDTPGRNALVFDRITPV